MVTFLQRYARHSAVFSAMYYEEKHKNRNGSEAI